MPVIFGIILALMSFLAGLTAAHADSFSSDEPVTVYSRPSTESKALGTLRAGRSVEVDKKGRRWYRVFVKTSKGKTTGFILAPHEDSVTENNESMFQERNLFSGWRVGMELFYSSYMQASRVFKDSDGNETDISNLSGTNAFYGFLVEWPWTEKMTLRAGITFRKVDLGGTVRYQSGSVLTANTPVSIHQEFTSFVAGGRYTVAGKLWVGSFFEFASGTKSRVFDSDADKPTYFIIQPAVGYDYKPHPHIWVQPEFRLGVFANTKPFMFNPEWGIGFGWDFD